MKSQDPSGDEVVLLTKETDLKVDGERCRGCFKFDAQGV